MGRERVHHSDVLPHGACLSLQRVQVSARAELDHTAYWASVVGININGTAPFLGPFIAQFLRGGAEIGPDTLARFYSLHMLVLPGALFGLIGLHLYLVVRLGVSPNPWTKNAAGSERAEEESTARSGLTRPGPRGKAE